jgi:hypothetical protein
VPFSDICFTKSPMHASDLDDSAESSYDEGDDRKSTSGKE